MAGVLRKIKKFLVKLKNIDVKTQQYEKLSQVPSIPSEAFVNMGLYWVGQGDFEKAKEHFETSVSMANPSPDAYINLGIYHARMQDYEKAQQAFRNALKIDKYNARAYALWATALVEMNEFEQAEEFYERASKLDSRDSDIYLNWGISLAKQGKRQEAEIRFKKAYFYNPLNFHALFMWSVLLTELNRYEEAIEKLTILLLYSPDNSDVYYYLAYSNFKLKKHEEARLLCEKAIEKNPKKIEAYILAAELDFILSKGVDLLNHYQKAVDEGLESVNLYNAWAVMLQSFGRFEEAKEKNLRVLQLQTYHEQAMLNYAICDYNLDNIEQARQTLEKFLELYPQNYDAAALIAKVYIASNEQEKAIDILLRVVNETNNHYKLYYDIANIYHEKGEIELAKKYYEKVIEYVPEYIEAYLNYTKFLCEIGDAKTAIRKIRTAYSLNKLDSRVVFAYGIALIYSEMYLEAIKKFEEVEALNSDIPEVNIGYAEALHKLGRDEEAAKKLELVSDKHFEMYDFTKLNFDVHYALAQNSNSAYNIEKALKMCEKLEELGKADEELYNKKNVLCEMSKQ